MLLAIGLGLLVLLVVAVAAIDHRLARQNAERQGKRWLNPFVAFGIVAIAGVALAYYLVGQLGQSI